jgi:hypothetical protein
VPLSEKKINFTRSADEGRLKFLVEEETGRILCMDIIGACQSRCQASASDLILSYLILSCLRSQSGRDDRRGSPLRSRMVRVQTESDNIILHQSARRNYRAGFGIDSQQSKRICAVILGAIYTSTYYYSLPVFFNLA